MTHSDSVRIFLDALLAMDRVAAKRALGGPTAADARLDVVERLVVPSLERIGDLWERGEVSVTSKATRKVVKSLTTLPQMGGAVVTSELQP